MTNDEEEAEVLNADFASFSSSKTSCSQSAQPPQLEYRDGDQKEALIIQEEMIGDVLHHLDAQNSMELHGTTQAY